MDPTRLLSRIEARLEALNMSANAASKAANTPDAIRNLRRAVKNGTRGGMSTATIAALARVLETTPAWLLEEKTQISLSAVPLSSPAPERNGSTDTVRTPTPREIPLKQIAPEAVAEIAAAIEKLYRRRQRRRPTDAEMEYLAQSSKEVFAARRVLSQFDHQEEPQIQPEAQDRKDEKGEGRE
jgi:hypothetical protein